jgi:hypothetical protein
MTYLIAVRFFLSLPKVDSNTSSFNPGPFGRLKSRYQTFRHPWCTRRGGGSVLSTLLESTFGRDVYTSGSDRCSGVGATQSISERPVNYAPGRPVPTKRYPGRKKSASIVPARPSLAATGRPGLGVKSPLYLVLGRPYQTLWNFAFFLA